MAREEALRAGENIKELTVRGIILGPYSPSSSPRRTFMQA